MLISILNGAFSIEKAFGFSLFAFPFPFTFVQPKGDEKGREGDREREIERESEEKRKMDAVLIVESVSSRSISFERKEHN